MHTVKNILVPLADHTTLAADLSLPRRAGRFPVVISFTPYRKDDIGGVLGDSAAQRFTGRGCAHLLVDVRGYGGSEGIPAESMHPTSEGRDAAEVVEWAAAQPWCDGRAGVWGMSYGGMVALAVGAQRPSHLRAIASVYGPWSIHAQAIAPGGTRLCLGRYAREALILAQELTPPSFQDDQGRWRRVWEERIAARGRVGPSSLRWALHPPATEYWRERTVDLTLISVPTLLMGGWRDLYAGATVEAFQALRSAGRLVLGPWLHAPPDTAIEPVDWIGAMVEFFAEHIAGARPPAPAPPVSIYLQNGGGWLAGTSWPPVETGDRRYCLAPGSELLEVKGRAAGPGGADVYVIDSTVGVTAGLYDLLALGVGLPEDQGVDVLASLAYRGSRLSETVDIVGSPLLTIEIEIDPAPGNAVDLTAKLIDLAPDGQALLITSGWRRVEATGTATITMAPTAFRLEAGHRLGLSIAGADFPRFWPTLTGARICVALGTSSLSVPIAEAVATGPPSGLEPAEGPVAHSRRPGPEWTICRDRAGGGAQVTVGAEDELGLERGASMRVAHRATAWVDPACPATAGIDADAEITLTLASGEIVEVKTSGEIGPSRLSYRAVVTMNGETVLERSWDSEAVASPVPETEYVAPAPAQRRRVT